MLEIVLIGSLGGIELWDAAQLKDSLPDSLAAYDGLFKEAREALDVAGGAS